MGLLRHKLEKMCTSIDGTAEVRNVVAIERMNVLGIEA